MTRTTDEVATGEELQRGERFLAAYNVIEQAMQRRSGDVGSKEGFRRLVDQLSDRDWTVREFRDDLIEFAELRNAIVHERTRPGYLIAVPLKGTVDRIEGIAGAMERPPLVYPQFKREVARFNADDPMRSVFSVMSATGYSQFPVYRGSEYLGLLTDGGIARWVARALTGRDPKETRSPSEGTVGDVLKSEKNPDRAQFISRDATVYQAEQSFVTSSRKEKWRVSALLITENGLAGGKLLGIITPSDILALTRE